MLVELPADDEVREGAQVIEALHGDQPTTLSAGAGDGFAVGEGDDVVVAAVEQQDVRVRRGDVLLGGGVGGRVRKCC